MDEEDEDQNSRKMAIKGLIAHLGYDDESEPQGDDGLGKDFMADSFANLAKKKSKGKGGGGGGMPGMGGGGGGGGGGGMDLSSLSSLTSMI